ncbi:piwi-like protein 1 [Brevipalpus obovatus]|uniref:piwi-like protein 1 n=1 Tax=Brevipalpus obovatus TaxID=246614 RepID=UPI003D9E5D5F
MAGRGRGRGLRLALGRISRGDDSSDSDSSNSGKSRESLDSDKVVGTRIRIGRGKSIRSAADGGDIHSRARSDTNDSGTAEEDPPKQSLSQDSSPPDSGTCSLPVQSGTSISSGFTSEERASESSASSRRSSAGSEDTSRAQTVLSGGSLLPPNTKVYGTFGTKIKATVNFLRVSFRDGKDEPGVHLYHVGFEPAVDNIRLRRKALFSCSDIITVIGDTMIFTGYNLYLPKKIEDSICGNYQQANVGDVKITVKYISTPSKGELVTFYNNFFNQMMRELKLVQINRRHYDPDCKIPVPAHKLEIWPGYVCAIQDLDGGLLLSCDSSHRVLRSQTAHDLMGEIYFKSKKCGLNFFDECRKKLIGCTVLTRYNNKTYRIDDIDTTQTPLSTFKRHDGDEITFEKYFLTQWNQRINDKAQVLLIHRPKARRGEEQPSIIALVPELCHLTGLTEDLRKDFKVMKDLAHHTRLHPHARFSKLKDFIQRVNRTPSARKFLTDWGFQLEPQPLILDARTLKAPTLVFGREKFIPPNAEWRGQLMKYGAIDPKNFTNWFIICNRNDLECVKTMLSFLMKSSLELGSEMKAPTIVQIEGESPKVHLEAIKAHCIGAQMVMIVTPGHGRREDRYKAIKKLSCEELGIPTQCVRAGLISRQNMLFSVCRNLVSQMTCKLGGALWRVKHPLESVMVIGMDAYHDPHKKSGSVLGFVASIDNELTSYTTRVFYQDVREEISSSLRKALVYVLKEYVRKNDALPARIFIYRDGVGDGDFQIVEDYEIPQLHSALDSFTKDYEGDRPLITFTVVQKRIDAKISILSREKYENPPPGTIVDGIITRKNRKDFFLVSQRVDQGTVNPTHYVTLLDENEFYPDRLQVFTYLLTHLYYNFPAAIRVPAPCQLAHKAAYHMGQNCSKDVPDSLNKTLYYL